MNVLKLKLEGIFGDNVDIEIESMIGSAPLGVELQINDLFFINDVEECYEVWNDEVKDLFYFQTEDELIDYIKINIEEVTN
jgi:hypothetical protein